MLELLTLLLLLGQSEEVDALLRGLRSERVEERDAAGLKLKLLGSGAVPALRKVAEDSDPELSSRSRRLLRIIEVRSKLSSNLLARWPGLDERLSDGSERAWTEAFLELGQALRNREQREGLSADDLDYLAPAAIRAARPASELSNVLRVAEIWELSSVVPEVIGLLRNPGQVRSALNTLDSIGDSRAVPELERMIRESHGERLLVSQTLVRISGSGGIGVVSSLLTDGDDHIRRNVAHLLSRFGVKAATKEVMEALGDEKWGERERAIGSAENLELREAIPRLIELLRDEHINVYSAASKALAKLRAKEAIPALMAMMRSEDPNPRAWASLALIALDARDQVPELFSRAAEGPLENREGAGFALRRLAPKEWAKVCASWLDHEDVGIRTWAAWELGQLGMSEYGDRIVKLMDSLHGPERFRVAESLAVLRRRDSIPALKEGLVAAECRPMALKWLSRLQAREAKEDIKKLLENSPPAIQKLAAATLCDLGDSSGVPVLLKVSDDLTPLNGFREPEAWERFSRTEVFECEGSVLQILEAIAGRCGLALDVSELRYRKEGRHLSQSWRISPSNRYVHTLGEAVGHFNLQVVVERDRLRVLSNDKARTFWLAWWRDRSKTK